jgi:hypothetical protein
VVHHDDAVPLVVTVIFVEVFLEKIEHRWVAHMAYQNHIVYIRSRFVAPTLVLWFWAHQRKQGACLAWDRNKSKQKHHNHEHSALDRNSVASVADEGVRSHNKEDSLFRWEVRHWFREHAVRLDKLYVAAGHHNKEDGVVDDLHALTHDFRVYMLQHTLIQKQAPRV